jgi:hypothetical protein
MASVNVILALIIVLGIIYMYINSRQYLVRDGFYNYKTTNQNINMRKK